MGLGNKESSRIHNKSGRDLTKMRDSYTNNDHIDLINYGPEAALLHQIQLMQNDIDEIRRYLTAEVGDGAKGDKGDKGDRGLAGSNGRDGSDGRDGADGRTPNITDLDGSTLPTSDPRVRGKLWNNRGTVKVS
mgnify:CR=1 FL=1